MNIAFPSTPTLPSVAAYPLSMSAPGEHAFPESSYFVFEGDSTTVQEGIVNISYPEQLMALPGWQGKGPHYNFGVSGQQTSAMVSSFAEISGLPSVGGFGHKSGYLFLLAGINDLAGGIAAATILANLSTMWAAARAAGMTVVAFTVPPAVSVSGGNETNRQTVNAGILSASAEWDYIADAAAWLPDYTDTDYFRVDQVHFNNAGTLLIAGNVAEIFTP